MKDNTDIYDSINQETIYDEMKDKEEGKEIKNVKRFVWKNTVFMSIAFMLNYTAYGGLSGLQSSLHVIEGMGTICTSIRYISLVISTLFVPELMIRGIGHKWTVTASLVGFIVWMAANGYGIWATMVPASIINGVFVAPLWAAQGSYFTEIAILYSEHSDTNQEGSITMLFGVFYAFYLGSKIFGNIISTTVLKAAPPDNYTGPSDEDILNNCGLKDCPYNTINNTNLEPPPDNVVWTLVGIYIAIAVCAILISVFLVDNLPERKSDDEKVKKPLKQDVMSIMTGTVSLMRRKELWLLVPITVYTGIEETFFAADFNRSWITCALGIWMIGFINVPFGFSSAVIAYFCGSLTKLFGRLPIIFMALVLDVVTQFTLAFWDINSQQEWVYYMISLVWGTYDGIWITISSAMWGIIFPNDSEAAYSNLMLFQCLGYATAFGYSYFLCASVKLYIMFASLIVAIITYVALEYVHRQNEANSVELAQEVELTNQAFSSDEKRRESFVYTIDKH